MKPLHAVWWAAAALAPLLPAQAADSGGRPGPGRYRVDAITTTETGYGAMVHERVHQVDGATGRITVTDKGPPGSGPPVVRSVPGEGANLRCVAPLSAAQTASSSPPQAAACYSVGGPVSPSGGTAAADCAGVLMNTSWRRIAEGVWEVQTAGTRDPSVGGGDVSAAVRAAIARLPADQQARLDPGAAAIASGRSTPETLAPAVAHLQAKARSGTPAEAAQARAQLDALQRSFGLRNDGQAPVRTRHREVWTRVAESCSPY